MSEFKWPHQPNPRQVGSIVDDQVRMWALKKDEHGDTPSADRPRGSSTREAGLPEADGTRADRLGFRYWGDAIALELVRLMHRDESDTAYLIDGMNETPDDVLLKHGPARSSRDPTGKRH